MEYIERTIERKFLKMNQVFKAILVTGARQVGKTTMLRHLAKKDNRVFVSLDDFRNRELAENDPKLFFQMYKPPVLIDEIQKAPALFEEMKLMCDNTEETGLFWLTGSESRKLVKEAGDSLVGRICILRMYSLSQKEKEGVAVLPELSFALPDLMEREKRFKQKKISDIYEHIWHGGMPGALHMDQEQLSEYYSSYISTYLMRDAVDDNGVADTVGFLKVLKACAAFIGNLINYSDIAAAGGVSVPTAMNWLKILQNMGIIYLLDPYYNNELKRLVKTPKLYFCDTGLAAYLSMWTSKDVLMNGAASGHYFENYVVGELIREYSYSSKKANLTFYRDTNQKEIDLLIEDNGVLHPIEIKRTASPERKILKSFDVLRKSSCAIGDGGIICMAESVFPMDESNNMIPCGLI